MEAKPTMTPAQLAEWEEKARAGALFGKGETAVADVIRSIARYRWPDGRVPYGAQHNLSRETGISVGWINTVLRGAGYECQKKDSANGGATAAHDDGDPPSSRSGFESRPAAPSLRETIAERELRRLRANRPQSVRDFLGDN